MNKKTKLQSVALIVALACFLISCHTGKTTVLDTSGKPVSNAILRIDYPSFNGPEYKADKNGVIHYDKSHSFTPVQVIVDGKEKGSVWLQYPPPEIIFLDGSKREND